MLDRIRRIVMPTSLQTLAVSVLATAILVGVYANSIATKFYTSVLVDQSQVNHTVQTSLANLNQFSLVRTGVEVGFWALVGIGCYIVYLAITNALIETRNEVVIDTQYARRPGILGAVGPAMRQIVVAVVLLAYLVFGLRALLDVWLGLVDRLVFNGFSMANLAAALGGWVGLALTLYLAWMLIELTFAADTL